MNTEIEIAGRRIGPGWPVYLVAELSANHRQRFEVAVQLIQAAKDSGADAVKLQIYTPDTLTISSPQHCFRIGDGTPWQGRRLYDLYAEACMPWDWYPKLARVAADVELDLFATAYDDTAVGFLGEHHAPAYKIASFELVDLGLLDRVARTGKPILLSTGMATFEEVTQAVEIIRAAGGTQLALLKCTSAYPAPPEEMHLRTIPHLHQSFGLPVGLSDHTLGAVAATAAVALGACIMEKHLTLSRSAGGPDAPFSLEPSEFKQLVDAIRTVEQALGEVRYGAGAVESHSRQFRRSLFAVEDISAGEPLTLENVRSIRPGHGLPPRHLREILGCKAKLDIERGTPLSWDLV